MRSTPAGRRTRKTASTAPAARAGAGGAPLRAGKRPSPTRLPRDYASSPCFQHELDESPPRSAPAPGFGLKRAYDGATATDGYRVLVDRLWPRGLTKARAALDEWAKDLAPSADLRRWYHADRSRWDEFARRYRAELRAQGPALDALRGLARQRRVTLIYAAQDTAVNHAQVLLEVLTRR